jgi:hypothetical protein
MRQGLKCRVPTAVSEHGAWAGRGREQRESIMDEFELERAAAAWRASASPTDFIAAAERIPVGYDRARVRELFGAPSLVSPLANGGESWLYVPNDPARGQFEALFVSFDPAGRFARLNRKSIE